MTFNIDTENVIVIDIENLARYLIKTSFSQERMQYLDQKEKVVNTAKSSAGQETEGGNTLSVGNRQLYPEYSAHCFVGERLNLSPTPFVHWMLTF